MHYLKKKTRLGTARPDPIKQWLERGPICFLLGKKINTSFVHPQNRIEKKCHLLFIKKLNFNLFLI
jgi:hypothetical protein